MLAAQKQELSNASLVCGRIWCLIGGDCPVAMVAEDLWKNNVMVLYNTIQYRIKCNHGSLLGDPRGGSTIKLQPVLDDVIIHEFYFYEPDRSSYIRMYVGATT